MSISKDNGGLIAAAKALARNDLPVAEQILRPRLKESPNDVVALRLMAELATRAGRLDHSEIMLRRALKIAPDLAAARFHLAATLYRQGRAEEALAELEPLLALNPQDNAALKLKAAVQIRFGSADEALAIYEMMLASDPGQSDIWMSYGHVLKMVGRQQDSIEAYRRATANMPTLGEAWWSLANLKTATLGKADMATMSAALRQESLSDTDRFHLHFALGKAHEDAGSYELSFRHYAEGNRLRRTLITYDPDAVSKLVSRSEALFTPDFFAARHGHGCPCPDPIFILGMPRSGSTLIEQMLASHPLVEGTAELPDIPNLAKGNGRRSRTRPAPYPDWIAELSADECIALGESYLQRTRAYRKTERPFFIDKLPNNWQHIGFIHLILPNARIIDVRRHPLGCCFSNYKQHFASGQDFSYDQRELARYYVDYVRLLRHIDHVLPGRVHQVTYEDMICDPETQLSALLKHLGLPFEKACLRFYENPRPVKTASSEQVRQPLNRAGLDHWRHYEPFLGPMKEILGPRLPTDIED